MIEQGSVGERHERANFRNMDTIGFEIMKTIVASIYMTTANEAWINVEGSEIKQAEEGGKATPYRQRGAL
jgi:hypothetical protein